MPDFKSDWIFNVEEYELKILEKLQIDFEEISIFFCDDDFIKNLNKTYRDIDRETDILSFENGEKYIDENEIERTIAGDIIISLETLPKNSSIFNVSQNEELKRLLIHGTLHLNGMDHKDALIEDGKESEDSMLKLQESLLKGFSQINLINA